MQSRARIEGCIYIKRLADVDLAMLESIISDAYGSIRRTCG